MGRAPPQQRCLEERVWKDEACAVLRNGAKCLLHACWYAPLPLQQHGMANRRVHVYMCDVAHTLARAHEHTVLGTPKGPN